MSDENPPDWLHRAKAALGGLRASPALLARVKQDVDAFFADHPEEERNALNEALVTSLVLDRLTETQTEETTL